MRAYIIRRLIQALLVIVLVTFLVFIIVHVLPGDPVLIYMTQEQYAGATAEQIEAMRHEFGLDRPVIVQYVSWVSDLLHGDLGRSVVTRLPVSQRLASALPISLHLGLLAFLLANIIGIPMGVVCAVRRGKWIDTVFTVFANLGITAPVFWVAIILIYVFGLWLNVLPVFGYISPLQDFWASTERAILPIVCLTFLPLAMVVRQTRSAMLEVVYQDYIRTAWSKGLRERAVIIRHALKNGLLPVVTLAGLGLAHIVAGQVLIEKIFGIRGMGSLAVESIYGRDYAVIQGVILVVALAIVLTNLVVDIAYSWLDPRVRY